MGSVKFKHLNYITRQIWEWCENKHIFVLASYINTTENFYADKESRSKAIELEYELSDLAFQKMCSIFGVPTVGDMILFLYSLDIVMTFLGDQFANGSYYSTLNSQGAAIVLIFQINNSDKAILKGFLKGVYNQRPSRPKYQSTWDPQPVLEYLSGLYPLTDISPMQLTKKLVTLLALITGHLHRHRLQTFASIRIQNISRSPDKLEIKITESKLPLINIFNLS